jgi:hypothetical protein
VRWPRRQRQRRSEGGAEASSGGNHDRRSLRRRIWTRWQAEIEVAAAVATILAILAAAFGPAIKARFEGSEVKLEVKEVTVANQPADYRSIGGSLFQTAASEPTIEATVRNLGDDTVWIEEARITIEDAANLPSCVYGGGGGDAPRTKRYEIRLPEYLGAGGRVVRRDLHVEVEGGRGVRPVLSFQVRDFTPAHLYALHVELVPGPSGDLLDLGRFVIAAPGPLSRFGSILPENETLLTSTTAEPLRLVSTWCFRRNLAAVRRLIAHPGLRAPRVEALEYMETAPVWKRYVDDRPPRAAVGPLLRSTISEAPMFAVFAAEQSGDEELAAAVRRRAAVLLTERARDGIEDWARGAVTDAERALALEFSKAGQRVLRRAKARLEAEEEAELD